MVKFGKEIHKICLDEKLNNMNVREIEINREQLTLLNTFPSPSAILSSSGCIAVVNDAWKDQEDTSCFIKSVSGINNLFEFFAKAAEQGSDDALKLILGLRRVLDRDADGFRSTYTNRSSGETQWFNLHLKAYGKEEAILFAEEITRNIKTIHELRDSKERYKQQFNNSLNGIIIGTPDGEVIDVNPSACSILGYTKEELLEGGRKLIMDEENPYNKEASTIRNEQSYFEGEKRYIHKSGREISAMVSSVIFRDKDGRLSTINSFRDISREKHIQLKLKNEQEFAKTAISSIPGTFYVLDSDGTFLQWNDVFIDELGYSEEDMFGMKPVEFFHADDKQLISEKLEETLRTGHATVVARVITKSGEERVFKINARSFKNEKDKYIVGTGLDITELVEAKISSEHHYRLMDQLFENAPVGIVMIDHENKITRVNHGFRKMFGYLNDDVVGANVNELIAKGENRPEADRINKLVFDGKATQFESVRHTKDGKEIPVLLNTVPITNEDKVVAVYGIYVDLTEQKELEVQITSLLNSEREAREKAQSSLKEKEILLQEVHHRVKNNLAVIAGLLDLQLLEECDQVLYKKLTEVQSRIFSIAKIHETLYQEKNVVNIRFDNYLKSFVKFLPQQGVRSEVISELKLRCEETQLNLNQAVPAGLMINELINVLLPENHDEPMFLSLTCEESVVNISLQGKDLNLECFKANMKSEKFQYKLVEILVDQLNGTIDVNPEEDMVSVRFKKNDAKGSSNAFFN